MVKTRKLLPLLFSGIFILVLALTVYLIKCSGYWVSYQVSISMPAGWYLIKPVSKLKKGMIVVFVPPQKTKNFLLKHHWLPDDGVMMKHIVAMPGDKVCKQKNYIWINNKRFARYYQYYAPGKLLPNKKFCGVLKHQYYLLMSRRVWNSFDGRYFGPVRRQEIIGQAVKL